MRRPLLTRVSRNSGPVRAEVSLRGMMAKISGWARLRRPAGSSADSWPPGGRSPGFGTAVPHRRGPRTGRGAAREHPPPDRQLREALPAPPRGRPASPRLDCHTCVQPIKTGTKAILESPPRRAGVVERLHPECFSGEDRQQALQRHSAEHGDSRDYQSTLHPPSPGPS